LRLQLEEHLEPVIGYLTSATQLEPCAVFHGAGAKELRVDAELAVEIGVELEPAAFGAAIELVDVARPPHDCEGIVAGNVWHRGFALGPLRPERPPELVEASVRVNGVVADSSLARLESEEGPRIASALLAELGERLEPGDRIICGSLGHVPVATGDDVVADLGELGQVGVKVG
jgi:2-keto-4-pentenoate hydratase